MSELMRYSQPGEISTRAERRVSKSISRIAERSVVRSAQIEAEARAQEDKLDAIARVGARALNNTALLSELEVSLARVVPAATSRLESIADIATLASAQVMMDAAQKLGRS